MVGPGVWHCGMVQCALVALSYGAVRTDRAVTMGWQTDVLAGGRQGSFSSLLRPGQPVSLTAAYIYGCIYNPVRTTVDSSYN